MAFFSLTLNIIEKKRRLKGCFFYIIYHMYRTCIGYEKEDNYY